MTIAVMAMAIATQQTPWILGGFALCILMGMSINDNNPTTQSGHRR
jgi:hypothetical protein